MSASAVLFAVLGLTILFLPVEIAVLSGLDPGSAVLIQLLSAGFLAMASLNWHGRSAVYGGIYGRPIILANTMFGVLLCTTLTGYLMDSSIDSTTDSWLWGLAVLLGLYAFGFGRLMWSSPSMPGAAHGKDD